MTPKQALIIDDDSIFHLIAEEALLALGVSDVEFADDGSEGLAMITANPTKFDLVICDLQMPNLDGISVMRELGSIGFKGSVIIVSGEDQSIINLVRRMAQMVGIRILGTVKKPLTVGQLRSALETSVEYSPRPAEKIITRHALKVLIKEQRIIPFFQPKFDLRSNRIKGVEVLARLLDDDDNVTGPAALLKAAEEYELMLPLTMMMIEHIITANQNWNPCGHEFECAVNVSPAMLSNLDLPDLLAGFCARANVKTSNITIEITEDQMLEYKASVLEVLSRLRLLGFRLSLDDFGTGATSIEQLRLYPFNELKIDKSFVQSALDDPFAQTTVETSIRLAAMLQMSVVAEGVETVEQLEFVRKAGANVIQGYLCSRPLSASDLTKWLSEFDPDRMRAA